MQNKSKLMVISINDQELIMKKLLNETNLTMKGTGISFFLFLHLELLAVVLYLRADIVLCVTLKFFVVDWAQSSN